MAGCGRGRPRRNGGAMDLQELRAQIDAVDEQIVDLFEKRMEISGQVARYKIETGRKVFAGHDPHRF